MKSFEKFNQSLLSNEEVDLKDGYYHALWTAYLLEILVVDDNSVKIKTINGVRGRNCKTEVTVRDKKVYLA